MYCTICGEEHFRVTEYRVGSCRAPALECTSCHALNLSQAAAETKSECESVKIAIALRESLSFEHDAAS
jgi:hypothetical protein